MPGANTAQDLFYSSVSTEDPGSGGIIVQVTELQLVELRSGATSETRHLNPPVTEGKTLRITLVEDGGGDITVTVDSPIDRVGNTSFTLDDECDAIVLYSIKAVSGGLCWIRESHNGVSFPLGDGLSGSTLTDGDKGDITVSGAGATWSVDNNVITVAKFQQVATASFLGRSTAGTGNVEVLSVAAAQTLLNVEDGADVTDAANVAAAGAVMVSDADASGFGFVSDDTTLADDSSTVVTTEHAVKTYVDTAIAAIDTGGALTDGNKGDITVASSGAAWTINNTAVTLAKIQNVSTATILGRSTSGTGVLEQLSATTVRSLINVENGADVTDATNVAAAGAVMSAQTSISGAGFVVDEDDMASDTTSKLPTQQSVKYYTDHRLISRVTATGHSLVSGDLGKPIQGTGLYSAFVDSPDPRGVLYAIVDANTIDIAHVGCKVDIPNALKGTSLAVGDMLDWDSGTNKYERNPVAGTNPDAPQILRVNSLGGSTFNATVLVG